MTQSQVLTRLQKRKLKNDSLKLASVKHDRITQQEQSFAMVRTLLLSAVATISWLRQLFPKDCYKKRCYADMQEDGRCLYHTFHNTASFIPNDYKLGASPAATKKSWALRVLARGKTQGADKLLDWVNAVIEGILRDDLSRVQFSIYTDKSKPMNILESYTFSFDYHKDVSNGSSSARSQIVGLKFSETDGVPVTIRSARSGLARIIDRLLVMDIHLPALPADRFMMCHLFHRLNKFTPHLPQGFQPCQTPTFLVPDNEIWQMEERNLGCMKSGFHDVNLKMFYITHGTSAEVQSDAAVIPKLMRYQKPMQMTENFCLESPKARACCTGPIAGLTNFDHVSGDVCQEKETGSEAEPESQAVQMSTYPQVHGSLRHDDLITTQELSPSSQPENQCQYWILKPSIAKDLGTRRTKLLSGRTQNSETGGEYSFHCECGMNEEEGKTIQCRCCDARQHAHCYGFDVEEPREPHFCYQCLVPNTDRSRLEKLKSLARFRRALWIAYKKGYPQSETAFAQVLRYELNATALIIQKMKDEGYIALDDKNEFVLVHSCEQARIKDLEYFNPMTLIRTYVGQGLKKCSFPYMKFFSRPSKTQYTLWEMDGGDDSSNATSASANEPQSSHASLKRKGM